MGPVLIETGTPWPPRTSSKNIKLLAGKPLIAWTIEAAKSFMDEFIAAGMIPIALARWEMTGLDDEIKKLR